MSYNLVVGVIVAFSSVLLIFQNKQKRFFKSSLILVFVLLVSQIVGSQRKSLTQLDNDQKRLQSVRLSEYPTTKLTFFGKTLWLPIGYWFEGRSETIAIFRVQENFSELIDPNLYFFANHPREELGVNEFEKFSYLLLPFFTYGNFALIKRKETKVVFFFFLIPIFLASFFGRNVLGPFSVFPYFVLTIYLGVSGFINWVARDHSNLGKAFLVLSIIFYFSVFLQQILYAIY